MVILVLVLCLVLLWWVLCLFECVWRFGLLVWYYVGLGIALDLVVIYDALCCCLHCCLVFVICNSVG